MKFGQGKMRIRKQNRNVIVKVKVPPEDVPVVGLLKGCGDDGRQKLMVTDRVNSVTETETEDGGTAISRQREHHVEEPVSEPPQSDLLQGEISKHVDGLEDSINVSGDQLWQAQEIGEHVTRHYVRRGYRKGGDGPASAPFESPVAPAAAPRRRSVDEINENDGIKLSKSGELTPGDVKAEFEVCDIDEDQNHPSKEPEGSLLHTLYLQLLAADGEGITLRDLFASFKKQTSLPSLASDWKEQVSVHLKSNPHFDEVKGRYLLCEQLVQPKRSLVPLDSPSMGGNPSTISGGHVPSLRSTVQSPNSATVQSALSTEKHEGVQTRRKAYEKTIEAVLTESAMAFQKMQQDLGNKFEVAVVTESRASNFVMADHVYSQAMKTPLPKSSKKRKSSSDNDFEEDGVKNIRGSLKAMQARILAETGIQKGVPCSRKDDARKWRCPLIATEGHTLCAHHKTLQERKKAKKKRESMRLGDTKNYPKSDVQDSLAGETGSCQIEKEDVVAGLGGAHAIQALIDLQSQVPESKAPKVQSRRKANHITTEREEIGHLLKVQEDIAATNLVEEEEEPEIFKDDFSKTVNKPTPPAVNGQTSRISKTSSGAEEETPRNIPYERAIPGSLKAMQAKIVAESGGGNSTGVRCARKDGSNDSARKWQCPLNAMGGHTLCEHHTFLKERKRARYAAAKKKSDLLKAARQRERDASGETGKWPQSNIQFDEVMALLPARPVRFTAEEVERAAVRKSLLKDARSPMSDEESTDTDEDINELKAGKMSKEPESNAQEKPLPQVFKNAPKRRYVAAKKTASNVEPTKERSLERESSPLIRPPTIPPLPALYGIRRKAVKNRSLLSL